MRSVRSRQLRFAFLIAVLFFVVAAALGVPLGVWVLVNLAEGFIKSLLGFILVAYALFNFARPVTRQILSSRWGYLAGLATGCLGTANSRTRGIAWW